MFIMRNIHLLSVALLTVLIGGCQRGPALGTVTGTVRVNGQPLAYAYVLFQPIEPPGTYGSAYTDAHGDYELTFSQTRKGAPVGKHQVSIRAAKGDELPDDAPTSVRLNVPAKYNEGSELVRVVKAGHNEFDFELEVPLEISSR